MEEPSPINKILWTTLMIISYIYFTCISFIFTILNWFKVGEQVPPIGDNDENGHLLKMPAVQLGDRIKRGLVSSETLVQTYINRAEKINPITNSIVLKNVENALEKAREIDFTVRKSIASGYEVLQFDDKPFLGVPFTVKDCLLVKDLPIAIGMKSKKESGEKCDRSADCVAKMEESGAILLFVTNIPPMCFWWETISNAHGRSNNPYNTLHTTCGSSGGEGSLISSCGSVLGIGSDLGGSIRMPAHCAGIYGHKPSPGVVSNDGYMPGLEEYQCTMNTMGPLCRYVQDLKPALVAIGQESALQGLRLYEQLDAKSIKVYYFEEIKAPSVCPLDRHMHKALNDVVKYLETSKGMPCSKIDPEGMHYVTTFSFLDLKTKKGLKEYSVVGTLKQLPAALKGESDLTIPVMTMASLMPLFNALFDSAKYKAIREKLQHELYNTLGDDGVLILPTHATMPLYHHQGFLEPFNLGYTLLANCLSMPSTCVPVGFGRTKLNTGPKLPVSVQVMAKAGNDRLCLKMAEILDEGFGGWTAPGV